MKPQENIAHQPVPKQPNDDLGLGQRRTPIGVTMTGADRTSEEMATISWETAREADKQAPGCWWSNWMLCESKQGSSRQSPHCGSCMLVATENEGDV